jgi:hypothetical protein
MVPDSADPVFVGKRGGNADKKLATTDTLHQQDEEVGVPLLMEVGGYRKAAVHSRHASIGGVASTSSAVTVCLVGSETTNATTEREDDDFICGWWGGGDDMQ